MRRPSIRTPTTVAACVLAALFICGLAGCRQAEQPEEPKQAAEAAQPSPADQPAQPQDKETAEPAKGPEPPEKPEPTEKPEPVKEPEPPAATTGEKPMDLTITSTAFTDGQPIPAKHTGDGEDVSPPLAWTGTPAGTKELALIVDDPDAPMPTPWVHWVLWKIPADAAALPEGFTEETVPASAPAGLRQGASSWRGGVGYRGPAPPAGHGVHHYHFKLYALDVVLDLPARSDKDALLAVMKGHILAEAELIGTYQR